MPVISSTEQTDDFRWDITGFTLTDSDVEAAAPPREAEWIPAVVPGGVHESLIAAGSLAHPYRDFHERDSRWIEERSWWYRSVVDLPDLPEGRAFSLTFTGLDTVATVWIDGAVVAEHASQFRPLSVDLPRTGRTAEILLRFDPPLHGLPQPQGPEETVRRFKEMTGGDREDGQSIGDTVSDDLSLTLRRKAFFSWGWDFAPRIPSIGLTGNVTLEAKPTPKITHVAWESVSIDRDIATCRLTVEAEHLEPEDRLEFRLLAPDGALAVNASLPAGRAVGGGAITVDVEVPHPQLWWTHDLGTPALYRAEVDLLRRENTVDRRELAVGIRTIRLREDPDAEGGRHCEFLLNGQPIFARGANWVPADMLTGSVTSERRAHLLDLAREAGMTMIRVWGGGLYEPEEFYDLCDQQGLLVWQDFMFTSVDYPDDDPGLRAEVEAEASYQVRRLSGHPCLAVWAGNNEAHAMHDVIWAEEPREGWGEYFYDDLLPRTVDEDGCGVPYRRGSPDGALGTANGVLDGDRHAWEVWHGADLGAGPAPSTLDESEQNHFWRYRQDRGRFISEFGICSIPEAVTLDRWVSQPITPWGEQFLHRIKDSPQDKIMGLLASEAGVGRADSLRAHTIASHMVQAEGLAYGIAHYRRRQPVCSGALVWQLNEPWPGLSWSLVDYEGLPKAAWYAVRDAFAPVVASWRQAEPGACLELWVTNSSGAEWSGVLRARLRGFSGEVHDDRAVEVRVAPGDSRQVTSFPAPKRTREVYAEATAPDGGLPPARLFLDHLKNLPLGGTVTSRVRAGEDDVAAGRAHVTIRAGDAFAYAVRVDPLSPANRFDAAYFDLAPGQTRTVTVTGLAPGFNPADLSVRTWADDIGSETVS